MFELSTSSDWFPTCAVFDCDGVLLDSESKWQEVQDELCAHYNVTFDAETEDALVGSAAIDFARTLAEFSQPQDASDEEKKAHEKSVIDHVFEVESEMLKRDIDPVEGSLETIAKLSQVIPVAVASNSSGELLTQKMQTFGFDQYLTTWVSADDVENPKPAPDMYLEAVRRLGGDPQYALTVEDSKAGAKAAQGAGTQTMIYVGHGETGAQGNGMFDSFNDPKFQAQLDAWLKKAETSK